MAASTTPLERHLAVVGVAASALAALGFDDAVAVAPTPRSTVHLDLTAAAVAVASRRQAVGRDAVLRLVGRAGGRVPVLVSTYGFSGPAVAVADAHGAALFTLDEAARSLTPQSRGAEELEAERPVAGAWS